ncbi:MAG TPA: flagellar export chaperone FliS, partial [Chloroflexota bacterium]|nr:flagellar export chaperone FliS [Chloroflexota bacterium]
MPLNNPYQRYRQTAVNTSEPADLVVMTYEALLRWLGRAKLGIEQGQVVEAHEALVNAQKLVANLSLSLDFDRGDGIASNLRSIYDYLIDRLVV